MFHLLILIVTFIVSEVSTDFYAGRISPGKFEYPKYNGWMLVQEAKVKCQNDLACGGFTFKGSYKTLTLSMEMYFFHIVPEKTGTDYFYWSTYEVDRKFVKLSKVSMKKEMKHSIITENFSNILHRGNNIGNDEFTELDIVAFQPQLGIAFSKIDFEDFVLSNNPADVMILNLNLKNMIDHTFPKIDRCCKLNNRRIEFDGIDNMKRIDCDVSKEEFSSKYVNQREAIIMKGCQTKWKAKNWTIENILNRYNNISLDDNTLYHFPWEPLYQETIDGSFKEKTFTSSQVKDLINAGFLVKIVQQLPKRLKGMDVQNIKGDLLLDPCRQNQRLKSLSKILFPCLPSPNLT